MLALNVVFVIFGLVLVALTLNDVFQSAIVPRAVGRHLRFSFYAWRFAWRLWPKIAWSVYPNDGERREDLLAAFAPGMLVGLLVFWGVLLVTGYAAITYGLRGGMTPPIHSFGTAAYFAGTSLTTMGFGDIVGRSAGVRFFSILAGATGLGLFSIITAYLFALFGSFQTREAFVVMLGARTGTPPSGVGLLAIAGYSATTGGLNALLVDGQRWAAHLMESHLAYPVLAYFRSSHDYQSWVGTLGTLLDASTLLITTVEGAHTGEARIFYNLGRHAIHDLSKHLSAEYDRGTPGIERGEFDAAYERLARAGFQLQDRDASWERFAAMRSSYAPQIDALAKFFQIPPLQWIGDRSSPH